MDFTFTKIENYGWICAGFKDIMDKKPEGCA